MVVGSHVAQAEREQRGAADVEAAAEAVRITMPAMHRLVKRRAKPEVQHAKPETNKHARPRKRTTSAVTAGRKMLKICSRAAVRAKQARCQVRHGVHVTMKKRRVMRKRPQAGAAG